MPSREPLIGIVGLGRIGAAIAKHVLDSGRPMIGWARKRESLDLFVKQGGRPLPSVRELGSADMIISTVFDDDALRAVAFGPAGFIEAMPPGSIHIAMETVSPRIIRELQDAHAARGQQFLAAPVFGRPEAAVRGELSIICAGSEKAFRAVDPVLSTAGHTSWIGEAPEHAVLVKLIGNHMIMTMGELLAETFKFLSAGGVDVSTTKKHLMDELMPRIFAGYVQSMIDRPSAPRPAMSAIGKKDNQLLVGAAHDIGVKLKLAAHLANI